MTTKYPLAHRIIIPGGKRIDLYAKTDVRKTFDRARRELAAQKAAATKPEPVVSWMKVAYKK